MELLDERGRLFGRVNVVDAMVALVVLAVLASGLAVVAGGSATGADAGGDHATVLVHGGDGTAVENGSTFDIQGREGRFRVTDAARVVTGNGSTALVALGEMDCGDGGLLGSDGCAVAAGDRLPARTRFRSVELAVLRVGTRPTLNLTWTPAVARTTVPADVAAAVRANDTVGSRGRPTIEVASVEAFPAADGDRRLRLGLRLRTLAGSTGATQPVRSGARFGLETDRYRVQARIGTVGRVQVPGERITRTITVRWRKVDPAVAGAVRVGDELRGAGGPAKVVGRESGPARVVVRDSEGRLHEREHPRLRQVTLDVRAPVRQYDGRRWFQDRRLELGRTVVLDAGDATVVGEVVAVGNGNGGTAATNTTASG